jgi:uncharacterized protein (TIGR03435 family)
VSINTNGHRKYSWSALCAVYAITVIAIATDFHASGQTAPRDPSFEVATIKPVLRDSSHHFDPEHYGAQVNPGGAAYWSMTVKALVDYAYDLGGYQVIVPEGTTADRFDIEAKFPEGAEKKDERRMLQTLLKDRFKLAFHIEKREVQAYVLVVGKHGDKLRPSLPDPAKSATGALLNAAHGNIKEGESKSDIVTRPDGSSTVDRGKKGQTTVKFDEETSSMHFELSKMTMDELTRGLSICLGMGEQKVVNETGLTGTYQVAYDCPMPRPPRRGGLGAVGTLPPDPDSGYSLTQSLDTLGLKLEKRKVLVDVYVIDHVEGPSEN